MNRFFVALVFYSMLSQGALATELPLDSKIKAGTSVEFISFDKPTQWGSWLQMNLPVEPMKELLVHVEAAEKIKLTSRGEAHITVVTPVEYWNVLKPLNISMAELNKIALSQKIQASDFDVLCLGRASMELDGQKEFTYFVVVQSKDLINVRKKIQDLFIGKGGKKESFDALHYYPHITLGFTKRDLHESDGVIKGSDSCVYKLKLVTK